MRLVERAQRRAAVVHAAALGDAGRWSVPRGRAAARRTCVAFSPRPVGHRRVGAGVVVGSVVAASKRGPGRWQRRRVGAAAASALAAAASVAKRCPGCPAGPGRWILTMSCHFGPPGKCSAGRVGSPRVGLLAARVGSSSSQTSFAGPAASPASRLGRSAPTHLFGLPPPIARSGVRQFDAASCFGGRTRRWSTLAFWHPQ